MIIRNKFVSALVVILNTLIFMACSSSVKNSDIPSTAIPAQEISSFNQDLSIAVSKNIDVLAPAEYEESVKWRDEAKHDLAKNEKQDEILDDVRKGRGFLVKAYAVSENREVKAQGLFDSRQFALKAGAGIHPELQKELKSVDSDVSDKADNLSNLSADDAAKLQERYTILERRAVILSQLGKAQAMLNGAKKDGATKSASMTYKKSEMSLKTAEATISSSVRNPSGYRDAVATANSDAALLSEVMTTIKQNKSLSESAALKMVSQNRQINNLKNDMTASTTENEATENALKQRNSKLSSELATNKQDLASAQASVELQRVIEEARNQFSPEEAEAYQQGGNLLIRLKNVNFASGRSDLPQASLESLAKVSSVAKSLNATEIKVEGHTDSIGSEAQNKSISEQRAKSVASYFKSNGFKDISVNAAGYGFKKPIATNKSKEGRAQNRRVDIVITPNTVTQ